MVLISDGITPNIWPICDYSRSIRMPWTDQITEIAPHMHTYFWVTIWNKHDGTNNDTIFVISREDFTNEKHSNLTLKNLFTLTLSQYLLGQGTFSIGNVRCGDSYNNMVPLLDGNTEIEVRSNLFKAYLLRSKIVKKAFFS